MSNLTRKFKINFNAIQKILKSKIDKFFYVLRKINLISKKIYESVKYQNIEKFKIVNKNNQQVTQLTNPSHQVLIKSKIAENT